MDSVQKFCEDFFGNSSVLNEVMDVMMNTGVENFEDLKYLDPEKDFLGVLKPIQARKLKAKIDEAFQLQTDSNINGRLVSASPSVSASPVPASPSMSASASSSLSVLQTSGAAYHWIDKIPYDKLPKSTVNKLERGERPDPRERRNIVRIVVAELLESLPAPRKSHLEPVARELVRKYPQSFADCIGNNVVGEGHFSLLSQLIARVENCRRGVSTQLKRSMEESKGEKMKFGDKYGCLHHQPQDYPDGETSETQEDKRRFLLENYNKTNANQELIQDYMRITFITQRCDINKKFSIEQILRNWPFLCVRKYLFLHAEKLLDFTITERFQVAMKEKLPEVLSYFKSKECTKLFRNLDLEFHPHLNYLEILCRYFDEDCGAIFKIFEVIFNVLINLLHA